MAAQELQRRQRGSMYESVMGGDVTKQAAPTVSGVSFQATLPASAMQLVVIPKA